MEDNEKIMKNNAALLGLLMVTMSAGYAAANCQTTWNQTTDWASTNFQAFQPTGTVFDTVGPQGANGTYAELKFTSGVKNNVTVYTTNSNTPLRPDEFDVTVNFSMNTAGATYQQFATISIVNQSDIDSDSAYPRGGYAGIYYHQYTDAYFYRLCAGSALGTLHTHVANNLRNWVRFYKASGDPNIYIELSNNQTAVACSLANVQEFLSAPKFIKIAYAPDPGASSNTNSAMNLWVLNAYSNISIPGNYKVMNSAGTGIPSCNLSEDTPSIGTSPYTTPSASTTGGSGVSSPTQRFIPECNGASYPYGYNYFGTVNVACPGYPAMTQSYVRTSDGTYPTQVNVTVYNGTSPMSTLQCYQMMEYDANNTLIRYLGNANVFFTYISGMEWVSDQRTTDGTGKAYYDTDPALRYTVSGSFLPDYPNEKNFYTDVRGDSLIGAGCTPLIFKTSEKPSARSFALYVTVNKNGQTLSCNSDLSMAVYGCSSPTQCASGASYYAQTLATLNATACQDLHTFAGFTDKYIRVTVEKTNNPTQSIQTTFFNDLTAPKYATLTLAADDRPQLCFSAVDYATGTTVGNVNWQAFDKSGDAYVSLDSGGPVTGQFCTYNAKTTSSIQISGNGSYVSTLFNTDKNPWSASQTNLLKVKKTQAGTTYYFVNGTVKNSTGSALAGVAVRALYGDASTIGNMISNVSVTGGVYQLSGIPSGSKVVVQGLGGTVGGVTYYDSTQQSIPILSQNTVGMDLTMVTYGGISAKRIITVFTYDRETIYDSNSDSAGVTNKPLCDVTVELSAPGCPTISAISKMSADSGCVAQLSNGQQGCNYELYAYKDGYLPDRHGLESDLDQAYLTKSILPGGEGCQVAGHVQIENGTVTSPQKDVRVSIYKENSLIESVKTNPDGLYEGTLSIVCGGQYTVSASFLGKTVSQAFTVPDGSEGHKIATVDLVIPLGDVEAQNALTQMWNGIVQLWPIMFVMLVLLVFVVFNMLLEAL